MLPPKFVSPPYTAVRECGLPLMLSEEMLKVAVPLASETEPSDVVPSIKVTLPVGVPAPDCTAETVAVKVTVAPTTEELGGATDKDVAEANRVTTWFKAGVVVLALKLPSPA